MRKLAREYLTAVQFFTRIPVSGALADWMGYGPLQLRASLAHFAGVGILVGMAAAVAFAIVGLLLPETAPALLAAALACTAATILLTGAMHEAGAARLARAQGTDPESSGTIALVLSIGVKAALLAAIAVQSPAGVLAALVAGHAVSRFAALVAAHRLAPVEAPADNPWVEGVERRAVRIGAVWCLAPLLLMVAAGRAAFMVLALAVSGAALWAMVRWLRRRARAVTVDALGATQQVAELAFYLGAAIGIGGGR